MRGFKSTSSAAAPTTSAATKPAETAKPTTTGSATAATEPAKPAEASLDDILEDKSDTDAGAVSVDLSKVDDNAPALGGAKNVPEPTEAGKKLEWVDIGPISLIEPPGWQHKVNKEKGLVVFLGAEEDKAAVVFSGFDKPEDGLKKVDQMIAEFQFKDVKWRKGKSVKLGEDKSLPAFLSTGTAKDKGGKGMKLFFTLIKTGQAVNVLAIGGQDDDAKTTDGLEMAITIVALAKKH